MAVVSNQIDSSGNEAFWLFGSEKYVQERKTIMRVASFFAGIGGFDLGFERAGMEIVFQCEIDSFARQILKRHWPEVPIYEDITTLGGSDVPPTDLWCAGWPCQDLSNANTNRAGLAGKRSGLFYNLIDLVAECRPKSGLSWKMSQASSTQKKGPLLRELSTALKRSGIWGDGSRLTFEMRVCPTIETEFSLSQVIDPIVHTKSLLTAANCLGILRREERAGRELDPHFAKALSETLRLWSNVAEASGTPQQEATAPRYVPKLENIKEAIQTDQFYVARNLTWTECEKLMGFPAGWTVAEDDS